MNDIDRAACDMLFTKMDKPPVVSVYGYGDISLLRRLLEEAEDERDALCESLRLMAFTVEALVAKSTRADRVIEAAKSHRDLIISCAHTTAAADSVPASARRLDEAIAAYDSNVKGD
jgi:hypothetical protein